MRCKDNSIVNKIIGILKDTKFNINVFPAIENLNRVFYICLDMDRAVLETHAELQKFKMKLADDYSLVEFNSAKRTDFETFRTKDKQEIMMTVVNSIFNL